MDKKNSSKVVLKPATFEIQNPYFKGILSVQNSKLEMKQGNILKIFARDNVPFELNSSDKWSLTCGVS